MVLALYGDEERQKYIVMHQFGHALGLGHEQQMSRIASALDKSATIKWLIDNCELSEVKAKEKFQADYQHCCRERVPDEELEFDPGSIMYYP